MDGERTKWIHLAKHNNSFCIRRRRNCLFVSNNECSSADRALWVSASAAKMCRITFTVFGIIISPSFIPIYTLVYCKVNCECNKWTVHFPQHKYYYYRIKSEVDEAIEVPVGVVGVEGEVFCSISVRVQMPLTFCNNVIAQMPWIFTKKRKETKSKSKWSTNTWRVPSARTRQREIDRGRGERRTDNSTAPNLNG